MCNAGRRLESGGYITGYIRGQVPVLGTKIRAKLISLGMSMD